MKKVFGLAMFVVLVSSAHSYTIGGAYASLLSCDWGQYGNQYGYLGIYKVNGKVFQIFFGNNYCQH